MQNPYRIRGHRARIETQVRRPAAGFSFVELVIAMTVLVIAIGAIGSSLVASMNLGTTNEETALAVDAAYSAIERVRGEPFAQAFANFNADLGDDVGAGPGKHFAVAGLDLRPDDPDGFVGEVIFPGDGTELREDVDDRELGMPRDLSSDGVIDALDHAGDYALLPVRVRLEWTGRAGPRSLEVVTTIGDL